MSGDMFPRQALYDVVNASITDAKLWGKFGVSFPILVAMANFLDDIVIHLSVVMSFSRRHAPWLFSRPVVIPTPLSLAVHIGNVFSLRSRPQMARVDAGRIVAGVTHAKPIRNLPMGNQVRNAVRHSVSIVDADRAVASNLDSARPQPAGILPARSIDIAPKLFDLLRGKVKVHSVLPALSDVAGTVSAVSGYFLANNSTFRAYYYG